MPHATTYAVETEPRVFALVSGLSGQPHYSRPPRTGPQAILYVAHQSSDAELRDEPLLKELVTDHPGIPLFACDVRGIGDSRPDTCGVDQFNKPYGSDFFYAAHGLMLDRPYVAQRTYDVLRVLDWLADNGHTQIHLAAKGWGTVPAVLAAIVPVASPRQHGATSSSRSARSPNPKSTTGRCHLFIPNVLARYDLPECYGQVGS